MTTPSNYDRTPSPIHEILAWIMTLLCMLLLMEGVGAFGCARYEIDVPCTQDCPAPSEVIHG